VPGSEITQFSGASETSRAADEVIEYGPRTSDIGTKRTSSDVRLESAFRGKADYMCSERVFRLLVESRCGAVALGRTYLLPPLHGAHPDRTSRMAGSQRRALLSRKLKKYLPGRL
jgi:hypothetical protein